MKGMEKGGERWFVHFRGHSLGPISTEQLKTSLRTGEIGLSDKVASARDSAWRPLSTYPEFAAYLAALETPRLRLNPPPPPSVLLKKKSVAAPSSLPIPPVSPEVSRPSPPALAKPEKKSTPKAKRKRKGPKKKRATKTAIVEAIPVRDAPKEKPVEEPLPSESAPRSLPVPERPKLEFPKLEIPVDPTVPVLALLGDWHKKTEKIAAPQRIDPPSAPPEESKRAAEPIRFVEEPVTPKVVAPVEPSEREVKLVIQLSLNKKSLLVLGLLLSAIGGSFLWWNKTRDLKDSRLPDPSSPTITLSAPSDPFPVLKAPTHPRRD